MATMITLEQTEVEYIPAYYRDTGCASGGPSCLNCLLPRCVYDSHDTVRGLLRRQSRQEAHQQRANLVWLLEKQGVARDLAVSQASEKLGCQPRTVYRSLRAVREGFYA